MATRRDGLNGRDGRGQRTHRLGLHGHRGRIQYPGLRQLGQLGRGQDQGPLSRGHDGRFRRRRFGHFRDGDFVVDEVVGGHRDHGLGLLVQQNRRRRIRRTQRGVGEPRVGRIRMLRTGGGRRQLRGKRFGFERRLVAENRIILHKFVEKRVAVLLVVHQLGQVQFGGQLLEQVFALEHVVGERH